MDPVATPDSVTKLQVEGCAVLVVAETVVGDEPRAARKAAGLTQAELGDAIDASNVTISRAEHKEIQPFTSLRYRIHEWLEGQD